MAGYIFILFIGGFVTALLTLVSIKLDSLIRPQPQNTMIEMTTLASTLVAVYHFLWGLIVSLTVLVSRSLVFSMIIAVAFSLWTSWTTIKSTYTIYNQIDSFDNEFFRADIIQIVANFVIFPLTCFVVWRLCDRYSI